MSAAPVAPVLLYPLAALAEIAGGSSVFAVPSVGRSAFRLLPGLGALILFAPRSAA